MITIAVKTAERTDKEDYLFTTLCNLERGGVFNSSYLEQFWIIDTSRSNLWNRIPDHLLEAGKIYVDQPAEGIVRTLHQNARCAIHRAAQNALEWVMVIEDDIDVCADFLESVEMWLREHACDGPQMYVFGTPYWQILAAVQAGDTHWDYPIGAFYGAQCCVWRTRDAMDLAEWLGPNPMHPDGNVTSHGHDILIPHWALEREIINFKASAPSFVQHIGRFSGIGSKFFEFESWPGPNWSYLGKPREWVNIF